MEKDQNSQPQHLRKTSESDPETPSVQPNTSGSNAYSTPYQLVTRTYQEEAAAETTYKLLLEKGIPASSIHITTYNALNTVTDLMGNVNTEFLGDGSRDEYILTIFAPNDAQVKELNNWLDTI